MQMQRPEGDHRGSGEMNQPQQQPPQKCPRCESLNTKFCYYNNYSLSQPRYFCKTCRRYWTQGGTLRNVPVGGGCRKGKRAKSSSSGDGNSRSQLLQPPQAQQLQNNLASTGAISSSTPPIISTSPALGTTIETSALASHYYSGNSGFFSSLPTIHHSLNQPQPFSTHPLNVGGTELGAGSSNLNLLQGFNVSQRRQMQAGAAQFYHMGNTSSHKSMEAPLYPSQESLLIQSSKPPATSSADHDWSQSFMINKSNASASDHQSAMWSMANPNSPGNFNTNTTSAAGPSLNPNQWPDLGGL